LDNFEIKAESLTPEFKFDADYVLDGQLLVLPVKGKGKCTISLGESMICCGLFLRAATKTTSMMMMMMMMKMIASHRGRAVEGLYGFGSI
jgi:hypothetical protein